jgi:hypothetical protein
MEMAHLGLGLLLLLQSDASDALWNFEKGRTWLYNSKTHSGGKDYFTKYTEEVVEAGEKKIRIKSHSEAENGGIVMTHDDVFEWTVREGFLLSLGEGNTDPVRLFQIGAKKGQCWGTRTVLEEKGEAKFVGTEEIKVLAGTYKDAIHVEMSASVPGPDGKTVKAITHCFIVPKVGLVKLEWKLGDASIVKELVELKKSE